MDEALNEYIQNNGLVIPHHHDHHGPDWYDSYDHHIPHPHPRKPYCNHCRRDDIEKYGFELEIGGKYYTGSGSACCPVKCTVVEVTSTTVYYTDKDGVQHQKEYHDFMTSSWRDKSL